MKMGGKYRLIYFCGWVCPVCGKVLSPGVKECPCGGVNPEELEEPDEDDDEEGVQQLPETLPGEVFWIDDRGCLRGRSGNNPNTS